MKGEKTRNFVNIFSEFRAFALSISISALFLNLYFKIQKSANLNHYFNFAFSPEHGRHATLQALTYSQTPVTCSLTVFNLALSL